MLGLPAPPCGMKDPSTSVCCHSQQCGAANWGLQNWLVLHSSGALGFYVSPPHVNQTTLAAAAAHDCG